MSDKPSPYRIIGTISLGIIGNKVLLDVAKEREAQDATWGEQNHPDGTGRDERDKIKAELAKIRWKWANERGKVTWKHILEEEVLEAFAESDEARLREELVQVAAVAAAWVEAIDRRAS